MLVFFVILLSVLLTASIIGIILLWKAAERQMIENNVLNQNINHYVEWITDWRSQVLKTYVSMQMLDDKQMFSKDDEVGIAYKDISLLIQNLNDKIEEDVEEKEI